jgi:TrmH family RNA methyltransferase
MPSRKSFLRDHLGPEWAQPGLVAGVDEAGRGPLAGPVVAAAVILDDLQPDPRPGRLQGPDAAPPRSLFDEIRARALCCCIASASAQEIDQLNILQATCWPCGAPSRACGCCRTACWSTATACRRCRCRRGHRQGRCQGGRRSRPRPSWPRCTAIACAWNCSRFPGYGFAGHKGYPTAGHLAGAAAPGPLCRAPAQFCPGAGGGAAVSEIPPITLARQPVAGTLRRLTQDGAAYRRLGQVWLEGDHLCSALRTRGHVRRQALITEEAWQDGRLRELAGWARRTCGCCPPTCLPVSAHWSHPRPSASCWTCHAPWRWNPAAPAWCSTECRTRATWAASCAARRPLACTQVLALKGTAALWSPKVLRAGMGAHFGLRLLEGLDDADLAALAVPLLATSSHGPALHEPRLPRPCAWVLGHEGQGVSPACWRLPLHVRIPQPGGEESLNVAPRRPCCLYESSAGIAWWVASARACGRGQ